MTHPTDQRAALEPCPFCGSPALIGPTLDPNETWYAMCIRDDCAVLDKYWPTEADAIAAWNRRTPQ